MNPLNGLWIANLAKSRRHENHQFQSASLRFDVSGDTVSLTQGGVNMSGKDESSTLTLLADGEEHPVARAPSPKSVKRRAWRRPAWELPASSLHLD